MEEGLSKSNNISQDEEALNKLTQSEIDAIYDSKSRQQSSITNQLVLVILFFTFIFIETLDYHNIQSITETLSTNFIQETPYPNMTVNDIIKPEQIGDWLNVTVQRIYTNQVYSVQIPQYLIDQMVATNTKENNQSIPIYSDNDKAKYARTLTRNNYVVGMRVNVLQEIMESTEGSIYQQVIKLRHPFNNLLQYNGNQFKKSSNKTQLGNYTYRESGSYPGGYYGEGFVQYLPGNISLKDAQNQINSLVNAGLFNQRMSICNFEFMIYNYHLQYGIIYNYQFLNSNSGVVHLSTYASPFYVEMYRLDQVPNQIKLSLFYCWIIYMMFTAVLYIYKCIGLFCILRHHHRNDFQFIDFLILIQLCLGITIASLHFQLYLSSEHHNQFTIPFKSEDQFQVWADWAYLYTYYINVCAVECFVLILTFIFCVQQKIPSLGIIFETVGQSRQSMLSFILIQCIILIASSVGGHLIFGDHMAEYSTVMGAILANIRIILGDSNYEDMNKAAPRLSAIYYYTFIFVFCYFSTSMFQAILIQTYNDLRRRRLLLSEALARISLDEWQKTLVKWVNLLLCRRPVIYLQGQGEAEFGTVQIFRYNWDQLKNKGTLENKEQFKQNIKNKIAEILDENRNEQVSRIQFYKNLNQSDIGYQMLKNILKFIQFTIVQVLLIELIFSPQESKQFQDSIQTKFQQNALPKEQLKYFKSNDVVFNVINYQLLAVYSDYGIKPIINYFMNDSQTQILVDSNCSYRVTIRLYQQTINFYQPTAQIFPIILPPNLNYQFGNEFTDDIFSLFNSYYGGAIDKSIDSFEYTQDFTFECTDPKISCTNVQMNYTTSDNYTQSAQGQGGYVFEFNRQQINPQTGLTLQQLLSLPWNTERTVAMIEIEFVVYSTNFNIYTLVDAIFRISSTGAILANLNLHSISPDNYHSTSMIFYIIIFALYTIMYLHRFIKCIYDLHNIKSTVDVNVQERQPSKSFKQSLFIALNINENKIKQKGSIVIFFTIVAMFFYKVLITIIVVISAIAKYCKISLSNTIEFALVILRILQLVYIIELVNFKSFEVDNNGLSSQLIQQVSLIFSWQQILRNVICFCIFLQFIWSFQYLQFSIMAYMPINAVYRARKDLINIFVLLILFLTADAMIAYLLFGPYIKECHSIGTSLIFVLSYLMGTYSVDKIWQAQPIIGPIFFVFVSFTMILLATIFLAIIEGHFLEELINLKDSVNAEIDHNWFLIIYKLISDHWKLEKKKGVVKCCLCKVPMILIKQIDRILDPQPEQQNTNVELQNLKIEDFSVQNETAQHILFTNFIDDSKNQITTLKDDLNNAYDINEVKPDKQQVWNAESDEVHLQTQFNFWLYFLEQNLQLISRKQLCLNDFKGQEQIYEGDTFKKFKLQKDKWGIKIKKYFTDNNSVKDKFKVWQELDRKHLESLYLDEQDQICKVIQHITQVAGKTVSDDKNKVAYKSFTESPFRSEKFQQLKESQVFLWLNYLSSDEQYTFYFKLMSSRDRVRLWNSLVFPISYFQRVCDKSKQEGDEFVRQDLKYMISRVVNQIKTMTQSTKGNRREVYTSSVMRDLWIQLSSYGSNDKSAPIHQDDFYNKLGIKKPSKIDKGMFEGGESESKVGDQLLMNGLQQSFSAKLAKPILLNFYKVKKMEDDKALNIHKMKLARIAQLDKFLLQITITKNQMNYVLENNQLSDKQKYIQICKEFKDQDYERLPLWFLMTSKQKTDLLLHQMIESEAKLLQLMLGNSDNTLDLEKSLNRQVYNKYFALINLQAVQKQMFISEQRILSMIPGDMHLLEQAQSLKQRYLELESQRKEIWEEQQKIISRNNALKKELLELAFVFRTQFKSNIILMQSQYQCDFKMIEKAQKFAEYAIKSDVGQHVEVQNEIVSERSSDLMSQFDDQIKDFINDQTNVQITQRSQRRNIVNNQDVIKPGVKLQQSSSSSEQISSSSEQSESDTD